MNKKYIKAKIIDLFKTSVIVIKTDEFEPVDILSTSMKEFESFKNKILKLLEE